MSVAHPNYGPNGSIVPPLRLFERRFIVLQTKSHYNGSTCHHNAHYDIEHEGIDICSFHCDDTNEEVGEQDASSKQFIDNQLSPPEFPVGESTEYQQEARHHPSQWQEVGRAALPPHTLTYEFTIKRLRQMVPNFSYPSTALLKRRQIRHINSLELLNQTWRRKT